MLFSTATDVVRISATLLRFFMKKQRLISAKEIGSIIKKRRRALGISQEKLAEEISVTYQQIQRYERGENRLNTDNLQQIANILQMPTTAFFEAEKPATVPPDESRLLKHFRDIKNKGNRSLVIKVAHSLAKKG